MRAFKSSEPLLDRAFVVMTNQITDKFYRWQAKDCRKEGKIEVEDLALGNMTTSYELGSAVKGATLLTGYETGQYIRRSIL